VLRKRFNLVIIIALGANLPSQFGSPRATLKRAIQEIARHGIRVLYQSPIYLTAPVPISDQPWYHNAVIGVSTDKSPAQLIQILQTIEKNFGRVRTERNAPRVIDLDIVAYHDGVVNDADLIIPHPRAHERAFVLYPLRDIAPNWIHPVSRQSISHLIESLPKNQDIQKENRPLIMGVVNVTPDSFSDGGQFDTTDKAIAQGLRLIVEGADIIDIGGESTRPNAPIISPSDEQRRIMPVIEALKNAGALVSVDTRNATTMKLALDAGAGLVNDVTALTYDKDALSVVANSDCRVCLMHMQGTPQTMQMNPTYDDVVKEVYDYLDDRIRVCIEAGIEKDRLIVDVGIGFGKTIQHNIALFQNLARFHDLGVDVLLGASRKSFIEKICDRPIPPHERLAGSLAGIAVACHAEIDVVRVHDVAETRQFIEVYTALSVT
jgi:dihydropteroate synthase